MQYVQKAMLMVGYGLDGYLATEFTYNIHGYVVCGGIIVLLPQGQWNEPRMNRVNMTIESIDTIQYNRSKPKHNKPCA